MALQAGHGWHRRIASDRFVARVVQAACFVVAPVVLMLSVQAATRLATTPGEILAGVLGGSAVAIMLVALGVIVPLAVGNHEKRSAATPPEV